MIEIVANEDALDVLAVVDVPVVTEPEEIHVLVMPEGPQGPAGPPAETSPAFDPGDVRVYLENALA